MAICGGAHEVNNSLIGQQTANELDENLQQELTAATLRLVENLHLNDLCLAKRCEEQGKGNHGSGKNLATKCLINSCGW